MNMFSVPRQRTLSVLYSAYALWLMLRLVQASGVHMGTRTDNPYWQVRSIGGKHADEHDWLCLTRHIRVIFAVRIWYYSSMSILVFIRYVACSVNKSFCFHPNSQHFFRPPEPRLDYNIAINLLIVIMSYTSVALGRSVVSFLAAICFWFFLFLFAVI